jgi:carboxymethylenebutenolidase
LNGPTRHSTEESVDFVSGCEGETECDEGPERPAFVLHPKGLAAKAAEAGKRSELRMSETVKLTAKDGVELDCYVARPEGDPIGGLVVIQEIFGVNQHIRSVADGYAKDGFLVAAPALFDRFEKGVELGYTPEGWKKAMELMNQEVAFLQGAIQVDKGGALRDIAAALDYVKAETGGKVGTVGYCLGGLLSWLSACWLDVDAAVGYYAGGIGNYAAETPKAPVMLHFGKNDTHIAAEQVEKVEAAHPEVEIFRYDAGHAFNRDVDPSSYDAESAKLARERSVEFLKKNLA